jgi:hypothetical protein
MEQDTIGSLRKQIGTLERMHDHLAVRAPQAGIVLSRDLKDRLSTYVEMGGEIVMIGDPNAKAAMALVRQDDATWLHDNDEKTAELQIWGSSDKRARGQIKSISPRATDSLPHDAFATNFGGTLSVVERDRVEATDDRSILRDEVSMSIALAHASTSQHNLKLIQPRVPVEISIPREMSPRLKSGQTGVAFIHGRDTSLGGYLCSSAQRWIQARLRRNHGL